MPAPSVVIIASPYEGELLGRALSDIGFRVLRADDGEGAFALLATELPMAIILGTTLTAAHPAAIVTEARVRHESSPVYLLADPEDPLLVELRPRVSEIFRRPIDFDALAATLERLAVAAERAALEDYEVVEVIAVPPPTPNIARSVTQPGIAPEPFLRAHPTEELSTHHAGVMPARAMHAGLLLRADETLGELGSFDPGEEPLRVHASHFESRSTIAREIDRELSQAERRLFPGEAATPSVFGRRDEYADALSDIDLDALAIDTIPGLAGLDVDVGRRSSPLLPSIPPTPSRPIHEQGSLGDDDIAELLSRLNTAAFTGALRVRRPEGEKILYLDQGEAVGARSTLRHDQLAELLFREGKLSREQASRVRDVQKGDDVSNEGAARAVVLRLVDEGLLKESEIFGTVRRHVEEIFYSLFALENGTFQLGPALPPAEERVRLPPLSSLLLEGIRRKYGLERLAARLGDLDTVLHPTSSFARIVESAGLSADERRIASLFDGVRTLSEVRDAFGGRIGESAVAQLAWALRVTGALEMQADGDAQLRDASTVVSDDASTERRGRPRRHDAAQAAVEESVERERIASKRAQIADADYFAILGVARDASLHELKRAHARMSADFDPERFAPRIAEEHRDALREIETVLAEALQVLTHEDVRARYTAHLLPNEENET